MTDQKVLIIQSTSNVHEQKVSERLERLNRDGDTWNIQSVATAVAPTECNLSLFSKPQIYRGDPLLVTTIVVQRKNASQN